MIYSMTGYANRTIQIGNTAIQIEIRSVNHRFFDLTLKCLDEYKCLEAALRDIITLKIHRGKLDLRINAQEPHTDASNLSLNHTLLQIYSDLATQIKHHFPNTTNANISEIMQLPGVLIKASTEIEQIKPRLLKETELLIEELLISQSSEGEKLCIVLQDKIKQIAEIVAKARLILPNITDAYKEKLRLKLIDAVGDNNITDLRFQQEFAYFCQKIDVDEELTRLESHLTQFTKLIKTGGAIGKKIDFLTQEMHREANTFGAKSISIATTNYALELKVLIEQIKEQIQNIA